MSGSSRMNVFYGVIICSSLLSVGVASSKQTGCLSLAEQGNCEFYKCEEEKIACGEDGYALGYGYRYCNRFITFYNDFDKDGKEWVDDVRTCLMMAIMPFYNGGLDCDAIKRIAFKSHVDCYLTSGKGFCEIVFSNKLALWNVYQLKDFVGKDAAAAWDQVLDVMETCYTNMTNDILDRFRNFIEDNYEDLKEFIEETLKKLSTPPNVVAHADASPTCDVYAKAGDCRFYRCFQQRFPCDVFESSHVIDFELQLCEDFATQSGYFDSKGLSWLKAYNKRLMHTLLPLYNKASVNCVGLRRLMRRHRVDHLVNSGFCGVTDSTYNRWSIDRATDLASYPAILPDKAGLSIIGSEYYYNELSLFRRSMGYANAACYKLGLKQHATFYVSTLTQSGVRLIEQN